MASLIINGLAGIASLAVPLGELSQSKVPPQSTVVQVGIGSGSYAGGSVPHIALWDDGGNRVGQYHGDANGHLDAETVGLYTIDHDQDNNDDEQAPYVMLAMNEKDAICISFIIVSGDAAEWTWLGDMGKTCGADWYNSNFEVGSGTYTPACVWIDQDHSDGLRAQGMSLHMPDFSGSQAGTVQEYKQDPDSLCKSNARMTFWPAIVADALIPTFQPSLKYYPNGTDADLSKVIDRKTNGFPDPSGQKRLARGRLAKRQSSNPDPTHLVISGNPLHSAKETCEHPNSYGPDFVSTVEGVYCDMSVKEWWPLCSNAITTGCFDLNAQKMRGSAPGHKGQNRRDQINGRDLSDKSYKTVDRWSV
ncbi:hypothetical protein P7C71_g599, partial [Lecanoromycetidae sp. Uapishka_2]